MSGDSTIGIQPATPSGPAAPPLQLRLEMVPDPGPGGVGPAQQVAVQTFVLVDDQGRNYAPMTEDTGQRMCRLLARLIKVTIEGGGLLTDEESQLNQ